MAQGWLEPASSLYIPNLPAGIKGGVHNLSHVLKTTGPPPFKLNAQVGRRACWANETWGFPFNLAGLRCSPSPLQMLVRTSLAVPHLKSDPPLQSLLADKL